MLEWVRVGVADLGARIPARGVANTTKAGARLHVCIEHIAHRLTQIQVCKAHDACARANRSVAAAGCHGGYAVDELGFANRAHCFRTPISIHARAFHENRGNYVVTTLRVFE